MRQVVELLYQALETEIGGQAVYETAIRCAQHPEVKEEWGKYLEETQNPERTLNQVFEAFGLDTKTETPGRLVVRHTGESLVTAMEMALKASPAAAELVAAEYIVMAETKDHQNWELIGQGMEEMKGPRASALREAHEQVEEQEDEHLYHTMGWCRELWIESLGVPAVLPPPEEAKEVKTAIGPARAKMSREDMLKKK